MATGEYVDDGAFTRQIGTLITNEISPNWHIKGLAIPPELKLVRGDHKTPNPFEYLKTHYTGWKGFDMIDTSIGGSLSVPSPYLKGELGSISAWGGVAYQDDMEMVMERCAKKIYEQLEKGVDVSCDVYEWKQTKDLVKGLGRLHLVAANFLDTLVVPKFRVISRGISRSQQAMDYITQAWLMERYGVTPLMHTLHGIVQELNRVANGRAVKIKVKSGFKKSRTLTTGSGTYADPHVTQGQTCATRGQWAVVFDQAVDASGLDMFTTQSFPRFAWEVMPFSFIFDWFVNVGGYLEDLENHQRFGRFIRGSCLSIGYKKQEFRQVSGITQDPYYYWPSGAVIDYTGTKSVVQKYASCSQTFFRRYVGKPLPSPRLPAFKTSLNAKRLLDALALMWGIAAKSRTL